MRAGCFIGHPRSAVIALKDKSFDFYQHLLNTPDYSIGQLRSLTVHGQKRHWLAITIQIRNDDAGGRRFPTIAHLF